MSDGPKIIHPFADSQHTPKADELAYNAAEWAKIAKRSLPKSLGFIFIFFPRDAIGQAKGVLVSNVNQEAVKDELKAATKRWNDQRRIIIPGGD